jgi:hypothetical protein
MRRSDWPVLAFVVLLVGCGEAPTDSVPAAGGTEPELFFATKPEATPVGELALHQGPLVVRDGCVLIGSPNWYDVPIWPKGFTAERDDTGRLVVQDGQGGVIAIEGEPFEMGGGYQAEFRPEDKVEPREDQLRRVEQRLGYPIPERCLGSDVYGVWGVGETQPLD